MSLSLFATIVYFSLLAYNIYTMENQQMNISGPQAPGDSFFSFSNKNFIITILVFLLILSFLGINLLTIFGDIVKTITDIFGPLFSQILSFFGYTTGTVINKTADVVGDTAKAGIDIAEGAIQNVGNLLKDASIHGIDVGARTTLDQKLGTNGQTPYPSPQPDSASSPIQQSGGANKTKWCLVGEQRNVRSCIELNDYDKCMSGQVFPNQQICLNPALSQQ